MQPSSSSLAIPLLALSPCLLAQSLPLPGSYQHFVPAPWSIGVGALADLDGDGDADLVAPAYANATVQSLLVFPAVGGAFAPPAILPIGRDPTTTAVGDLDNDGDIDVAVTCYGTTTSGPEVWIYRNSGNGTFATPAIVLSSAHFYSVVEFLHADAGPDLDLWLVDGAGNKSFRLGLGGGAFGPEIPAPPSLNPQTWFDDDGDGDDDLHEILTAGGLWTSRNNGAAGFAAPVLRCLVDPSYNWRVNFADLDGDGHADALLAGERGGVAPTVAQVAFGSATGTLTPAALQPLLSERLSGSPILHDLDGDGHADLLLADFYQGVMLSARNDSTGQFVDLQVLRYRPYLPSPPTGDIDGDGRSDVLIGTVMHRSLGTRLAGQRDVALPIGTMSCNGTMAIGDFDLDGLPDAVCGLNGSNGVLLARNFGTTPVVTQVPVGDVRDLALGDWNRDGNLDVLVARSSPASVQLLLGNGSGGLAAQPPVPTSAPRFVRAADLDGDGRLDCVVVGTNIEVRLGDGSGNFGAPMVTSVCSGPSCNLVVALVADFDNDGVLDVAVQQSGTPFISAVLHVLRGTGTGNLQPPISTQFYPSVRLAQDMNGDGKVDLVCDTGNGLDCLIAQGLGNGTFGAASGQLLQGPGGIGQGGAVAAGDIDGDGQPDLAYGGGAALRNLGSTMAPPDFLAIAGGSSVAIADVDGDLQRDVIVMNSGNHLTIIDQQTATTGSGFEYGNGCPGTGGFIPVLLGRGRPQPGGSISFDVQRALGGSVGGLLVAPLSSALPFGLGCRLFVDLNGMVALALPIGGLPVPGGGTASLTLAIPPGLPPMQLASEAIVLDFASPFAVSGTGGVRVEIR